LFFFKKIVRGSKIRREKIVKKKRLTSIVILALICVFCFGEIANAAYWSSNLFFQEEAADGRVKEEERKKIILVVVNDNQKADKGLESLMLVDLELNTKKAQIISIPKNMYLNIKGLGYISLKEIYREYGLNNIIRLAKQCINAPEANYLVINLQNGAKIIDELGGVEINAPHSIEGYQAGWQRMSGSQLVSYSVKTDRNETREEWEKRQMAIIQAVVRAGLHPRIIWKLPAIIREMGHFFQTDFKLTELLNLAIKIRNGEAFKIEIKMAPGLTRQLDNKKIWVLDRSKLAGLFNRIN
jgi:anionic cell wall polymer biosynthesis LytR-Cps2A-Psr (LCP) family protein